MQATPHLTLVLSPQIWARIVYIFLLTVNSDCKIHNSDQNKVLDYRRTTKAFSSRQNKNHFNLTHAIYQVKNAFYKGCHRELEGKQNEHSYPTQLP